MGIELDFDLGIVATCLHCRLTWRVSRQHYRFAAWWTCPSGCLPTGRGADEADVPTSRNPLDGGSR